MPWLTTKLYHKRHLTTPGNELSSHFLELSIRVGRFRFVKDYTWQILTETPLTLLANLLICCQENFTTQITFYIRQTKTCTSLCCCSYFPFHSKIINDNSCTLLYGRSHRHATSSANDVSNPQVRLAVMLISLMKLVKIYEDGVILQ
jgi:hypothetical protein